MLEPARVDVEAAQMGLEVHVQQLAARSPCSANGMFDERYAESPTLEVGGNDGVEDERVTGAVPCHIDKPDQAASRTGGGSEPHVCCSRAVRGVPDLRP